MQWLFQCARAHLLPQRAIEVLVCDASAVVLYAEGHLAGFSDDYGESDPRPPRLCRSNGLGATGALRLLDPLEIGEQGILGTRSEGA